MVRSYVIILYSVLLLTERLLFNSFLIGNTVSFLLDDDRIFILSISPFYSLNIINISCTLWNN